MFVDWPYRSDVSTKAHSTVPVHSSLLLFLSSIRYHSVVLVRY
uniref:Uncharacterized protein n=1 Tax=Ascaris lumbricoides TaxID=6252 RepID=A0A0M3HID5_ASCLU